MTFEELHAHMNERIHQLGYENLDLHGNLGHSIEQRPEDRIYIEEGNTAPWPAQSCSRSNPTSADPAPPTASNTRTFTTSQMVRSRRCRQ